MLPLRVGLGRRDTGKKPGGPRLIWAPLAQHCSLHCCCCLSPSLTRPQGARKVHTHMWGGGGAVSWGWDRVAWEGEGALWLWAPEGGVGPGGWCGARRVVWGAPEAAGSLSSQSDSASS